jgi:glycosyltransferase involved in cell wall biosynthesis
MITYNHGPFIAQAIESVLRQKGDFETELVIGEDCSTDNTRAVIEDYQQRYPGKIRLITSPNNVGPQPNFIRAYEACRGEYVAMLEADDYWVDDEKLQLQVALLDQHPDLVMCFAGCAVVDAAGRIEQENYVPEPFRRRLVQRDIVRDYCPPTLTTLFRNRVIPAFPASFATVSNGDHFLYSMLTAKGDAAYLPRIVAHYRQHRGGLWTSLNQEKRYWGNLRTTLAMVDYFQGQYLPEMMQSLNWYYTQLCIMLWQQKRWGELWQLYREFVRFSTRTRNREFPVLTFRLLTGRLSQMPPVV